MFPTDAYNRVHELVNGRGRFGKRLDSQWRASWNAVALRYDSLLAHDVAFRKAYASPSTPENRSLQERELFGFFASGSSLFECCGYATHALLAGCHVPSFRLLTYREQRRVDLPRLLPSLRLARPRSRLTTGYGRLLTARKFREMQEIRNYLSHRSNPPRTIHLSAGGGTTQPDRWRLGIHGWPDIAVEAATTSDRLTWSADMLTMLVTRMRDFAEHELPVRRSL
jgi:hypothetical protein